MIRGESGTGKELVARAIHAESPRRYGQIVTVNCGAMTETLLESELFGHERGAFTGAQYRRKGKIELADGGTLFLDEVGNIDMKTQMDLLRVIETREFTRVGGTEQLRSDFRVICATNRDLEAAVREGSFREDLYYRLNVFTLEIPPLRGRRGDVAKLAHHFLEKFARQMNKQVDGFSVDAMNALRGYDWPGNVRELENAIERAMVVVSGKIIERDDLPLQTLAAARIAGKRLAEVESRHIEQVLKESAWNISRAATILDIDRVTLYHKIERYGLKR
jgi:transcriptional regulator with PAS, ATPase and Fis domain